MLLVMFYIGNFTSYRQSRVKKANLLDIKNGSLSFLLYALLSSYQAYFYDLHHISQLVLQTYSRLNISNELKHSITSAMMVRPDCFPTLWKQLLQDHPLRVQDAVKRTLSSSVIQWQYCTITLAPVEQDRYNLISMDFSHTKYRNFIPLS